MFGCIFQEIFQIPHGGCWLTSISNQFLIMQISSSHNSKFQLVKTSTRLNFCLVHIHACSYRSTFILYSTKKVWLLIIFFISFRVAFSQGFFMLSEFFFTSAKFLGYGMKWETSEPDSTKGINSCEISYTNVLNTLCKPFPMLNIAFNAPSHCDSFRLIRSRIS